MTPQLRNTYTTKEILESDKDVLAIIDWDGVLNKNPVGTYLNILSLNYSVDQEGSITVYPPEGDPVTLDASEGQTTMDILLELGRIYLIGKDIYEVAERGRDAIIYDQELINKLTEGKESGYYKKILALSGSPLVKYFLRFIEPDIFSEAISTNEPELEDGKIITGKVKRSEKSERAIDFIEKYMEVYSKSLDEIKVEIHTDGGPCDEKLIEKVKSYLGSENVEIYRYSPPNELKIYTYF